MKSLWPTALASKNKAVIDKAEKPFLFEYFNVFSLHTSGINKCKSILSRIFNEFAEALNDKEKNLPKYILIIPDKDIIEAAQQSSFGCKVLFNYMINWLASNIFEEIENRKEKLMKKRIGTVLCASDPKIVWVKMVIRPFIKNTDKGYVFAQSKTYNAILEAVLSNFKNMHLIEPAVPAEDANLFDLRRNLSTRGMMVLWRDINAQMSLFDKGGENHLKPWLKKKPGKTEDQPTKSAEPNQVQIARRPNQLPTRDWRSYSLENAYNTFPVD